MHRYILCALVLAGCSGGTPDDSKVAKKAARKVASEQAAAQPPKQRVQNIDGHQLITVETTIVNDGFAEVQRCFIWRDAEYKTASMQCPAESQIEIPQPTDSARTP